MARTKFSQAIHQSIRKQILKAKQANVTIDLEKICETAYKRVRTKPGPSDTPPRK